MKPYFLMILKRAVIAFLLIIIQTSFVNLFSIRGTTPEILLLFVFFMAMRDGPFAGTITGFLCGLILDVYSPEYIGCDALAMTVTGFLVGLVNERTIRMEGKLQIAFLLAAAFIHSLLLHLITAGTPEGTMNNILFHVLPTAIYTSIVGGLVIMVRRMRRS
ncbi:MAG: rod shape-determining protein MreD [Fibrobacteres bacterium]|nr:rod shape-determining protein MreD [Fibrobacterota bacterium]